jgi:hypothetical protein
MPKDENLSEGEPRLAELELSDFAINKVKALLKQNELLGLEVQRARQDLALAREAIKVAVPHVAFETKLAIWIVQALPRVIKVPIRIAVSAVFAFRGG